MASEGGRVDVHATIKWLQDFAAHLPPEEPSDTAEEFQKLLDYTPPCLIREPTESPEAQISPLDFYDLHVDESLQLKRVVVLPSLVDDIASRVQKASASLESRGLGPLPFNEDTVYGGNWASSGFREDISPKVTSPESIGRFYGRTSAAACMPLASQWILHPKHDVYSSILRFNEGSDLSRPDHGFVMDKLSLRIKPYDSIPQDILGTLNRQSKLDLRYLEGKNLATWVFLELLPEGQSALDDMVNLENEFSSIVPATAGNYMAPTSEAQTIPRDARPSLFDLPDPDYQPQDSGRPTPKLKRIYPQGAQTQATLKRGASRPVTASDLVQHAWTNAVRHDTTFIIFSTGNQERIGIRHRQSQTLYLSELINVPTASQPAYGHVQAGLYLLILEDVMDRLHQASRSKSSSSKRKRGDSVFPAVRYSKRQKINTLTLQRNASTGMVQEAIWKELKSKLLALVFLQSPGLNSPVPAAYARVRPCLLGRDIGRDHPETQRDYLPGESFRLVLGPCFSEGSIGKLHSATIFADINDRTTSRIDVVVKLAITRRHRRRVRREYEMYKYLWERNARGILPIYGLFEDYSNYATLLVMGKGGISLWEREFDSESEDEHQVKVSPKEREMFLDILQSIHQAGVCHRDIHPGNLTIDMNGDGHIIDFDRAHRNLNRAERYLEVRCLENLLDGSWASQDVFVSTCPSTPNYKGLEMAI
ncbi:hypothetical protein BDN72DRAFT_964245 [Pluteus cervinus]|uniref:Uncharacterized protein n=1 Tax=Pluteus cervinus TaxID=181527 RepID=A0ACD3AB93_9AGAR|nr:hypothetical protein BDN72DRAFT_964245 [Pluteus cervinus]